MTEPAYVEQLEGRIQELIGDRDRWCHEAVNWQNKYEQIGPRIDALEMIVTRAEAGGTSFPVGRLLRLDVVVNEDLILQCKDVPMMVAETLRSAERQVRAELEKVLIAGQLLGQKVPMKMRSTWNPWRQS